MAYPSKFVEFFGPCMWKTLHSVSFSIPPSPDKETQETYRTFFETVAKIIPCPSCRVHYQAYLDKNPVDASSQESLSKWVYDLHDNVNQRSHKKNRPTYEEVRDVYAGWSQQRSMELGVLPEDEYRLEMGTAYPRALEKGTGASEKEAKGLKTDALHMLVPLFVLVFVLLALYFWYKQMN